MILSSREGCLLFAAFVLLCAYCDLREMAVSTWIFALMAAAEILWYAVSLSRGQAANPAGLLPSLLPGAALLLFSRFSGGSLGSGDALFFLLSGAALGFQGLMLLLSLSLLLASGYSLILFAAGAARGKNIRNRRIPFLPFAVLPALLCILQAAGQSSAARF